MYDLDPDSETAMATGRTRLTCVVRSNIFVSAYMREDIFTCLNWRENKAAVSLEVYLWPTLHV
jgi:hypothetical protein